MADTSRAEIMEWARGRPRMADLFPITLDNGAVVRTLSPRCHRCGEPIRSDDFNGELRRYETGGRLITAYGYCVPCNVFHRLSARIVEFGESFVFEDLTDLVPDPFGRYQCERVSHGLV